MSGKTAIKLENIKKVYNMGEHQIFAINGISLTIQEGEMVAIMGSSGSGKSSLLNILGCLDRPTEGTYYLDGENVSQLCYNVFHFIIRRFFSGYRSFLRLLSC